MGKRCFQILMLAVVMMGFSVPSAMAALLAGISGLSNMSLPSWNLGDPDVVTHMNLCVYATSVPPGGYSITVSSPGGFKLNNGANSIPYSLTWDDGGMGNLGNSAGAQVTNNVALTGRSNANILSLLCVLGPNARLNLRITQAAMTAALAGTYTGTITILLSPN